ncbi:MAG: MBL fold metallo-hydrolase [Deltaproteobacteria bacterium]|nr:MBL fold metallo-hydrolase [Deltaproteobacteria bacterium]
MRARMKASPFMKDSAILGYMFKRLSLIFFIFSFLINPANAAEPEVIKLADGVYGFIGKQGAANSGFVVTNEGVVVIDAQGPKDLALLLKKKIHEITDKPIVYVINTHYHGDHTYGNQYFKEAKEIISHENTQKNLIEKDKQHREQFKKFFGENALEGFELTLPTKTFKDTLTLRAGGKTMELAYLGRGHTDGDIIVYLPIERIMFGGDLLYKDRLPWLGDAYISDWIETLKALKNFDAGIYMPGHGNIGNIDMLFALQQYLVDLELEVKKHIEKGKTIDEIKKEITLPKYKNWLKYKEWLPLNAERVYKEITGK